MGFHLANLSANRAALSNFRMKIRLFTSLTTGTLLVTSALTAADPITDARNVLEEWVETRQIISEEKAAWKTEQSILGDTILLLQNEVERLDEALKELEESATAADQERQELTSRRDTLDAGSTIVLETIGTLETKLTRIITYLPEPLTETIQPLIRRLPDNPEETKLSLGERVQNIVGILSQADKFNTTMTLTSETQKLNNDKLVQVNTLYWGLAIAYFVDDSGSYGGYGSPAEGEWKWTQVDGAGPAIRELLSQYDGSADTIKFVQVPAQTK